MRLTLSLLFLFAFPLLTACSSHAHTAKAPTSTTPPSTDAPSTIALKVMSFNIRYGTALDGDNAWPRRRDGLYDLIRHEAPDLLGLQEALKFQVDEILDALPGYAAVFAGRDDGRAKGEACAILYNTRRFELLDSGTFWLSDTPDHPSNTWNAACLRVCTWARLKDRATNQTFTHYNTHLDHMNEHAREKGIDLILARIRNRPNPNEPALLTGDFNDGERSTTVRRAATDMTDTFRNCHPLSSLDHHGVGTFNGFKNKTDGEKIDYILVTPGVAITKAEIVRTTSHGHNVSDHFPVTATLRL